MKIKVVVVVVVVDYISAYLPGQFVSKSAYSYFSQSASRDFPSLFIQDNEIDAINV